MSMKNNTCSEIVYYGHNGQFSRYNCLFSKILQTYE